MTTQQTHEPGQSARSLAGRSAIVTGSTSGIGLGIAQSLAAAGANLVLNGFGDAREVERTRAELAERHRVDIAYDGADLTRADAVVEMVRAAERRFYAVDILVNNAGIQFVAPIEEFPAEKWDQIIALNLSAAFHAIRTAFARMKERRWGRVINVSSAHGLVASPFKSAYVSAKHGIIGLTKVVALEGAEYGITANAICPGYVWTPLVEKQIDEQAHAHKLPREEVVRKVLLAQQAIKRFASVEEIGALTTFLATDAAQSITGTALPVDGGWTAH